LEYIYFVQKQKQKQKSLNKRNLSLGVLFGWLSASYDFKNRTFDAFLSQTYSTHASSYLSINSVSIEMEWNDDFGVVVKRMCCSFKWSIIHQK